MGPKTGAKTELKMEQCLYQFKHICRHLFANLSFLLKTHGAYTRALILRARAFKIHYLWAPFSAPVLGTENGSNMEP